jgi:hypothetical protein
MTAQPSRFVDAASGSLLALDPHIDPGGDPGPSRLGEARRRGGIVTWTLARGVLAGVVLGAAYRGWMRLIATDPSFSWEGTLFIVLAVTVVTLAASVCVQVRLTAHRRWIRGSVRVLAAAVILLGLGGAPATVTVPAFVLGGLAWGRRSWSPRVRRRLAIGAVVLAVAALFPPVIELGALPVWRQIAGLTGYGVLIAMSSWLFAIPVANGPRALFVPSGRGRWRAAG